MAVKKNVYQSQTYKTSKKELDSIIQFIETLDVNNIEDELDWETFTAGRPTKIALIEDKIKVTLSTIKESALILLIIHEKEGVSIYLEDKLFSIKQCLESIQFYYEQRPTNTIINRIITYTANTKKGSKEIKFVIASKYKQISDRIIITKKVLEILPILDKLTSLIEISDVKGDYEIPESMLHK